MAAGAGAAWFRAGSAPGPTIEFIEPVAIGQIGELVMTIDTPGGELNRLDVTLEQDGETLQVFNLGPGDVSGLAREGEDRLVLRQPIGRQRFEMLSEGAASVAVTAVRPVLFGYRKAVTKSELEIEVRLRPPAIGVQSQFHYINHGGSELVVYRVTPADSISGVRVGEREYPGFPAAGAGIENADSSLHVAFYALSWDQDLNTPISVFARDSLGNEGSATFDQRVFPKRFRENRINLNDSFMSRVVPATSLTSTRSSRTSRLTSEDFPTLGRPMMATPISTVAARAGTAASARSAAGGLRPGSRATTSSSRSPTPRPCSAAIGTTGTIAIL